MGRGATTGDDLDRKIAAAQRRVSELRELLPEDSLLEAGERGRVLEELSNSLEEMAATRPAAEPDRQRYQDLFEFAPDAYLVTDDKGTIREANRSAAALLGVSQPQLIGLPVTSFAAAGERRAFRSRLSPLLKGRGREEDWQVRLRPRRGRPFTASLSVVPALGPQGEPEGLRWLVRDVTVRQRAQEALRAALEDSGRRRAEVSALLEAARSVLTCGEFKTAARAIFDSAKGLTGATSGYVALLSKDGTRNEVLFLDAGGLPCTVDPSLPMPIRGLRAEAYRSAQAVYENDFAHSAWARYMPEGHAALDNVLFAPLILGEKVVGLLGLANKPGGFNPDDARMVSALADLAAIALSNSRTWELLQASEASYRTIFEAVNDAIIVYEAHTGAVLDTNQLASAMFGYGPEEARRLTVKDLCADEAPCCCQDALRRMGEAAQGEPQLLEWLARDKGGRSFWTEATLKRAFVGGRDCVLAAYRDITERKRAEEEMALLARFPAENSSPVLRVSREGVIIYANSASQPLLSFWRCQVKDPLPQEWRSLALEVLQGGVPTETELACGDRFFLLSLAPVVEAGYVNVYGMDITERKKAEEALRESEERLDLSLTGAGLGLWDWDLITGEVVFDERYVSAIGFAPEGGLPTLGRQWFARMHPEDEPFVTKAVQDHLDGRTERLSVEFRMPMPAGQWRWVHSRGRITGRDGSGRPSRITGTLTDITGRKLAEQALRKAHDELEVRVQERTRELKETNAALQAEITERIRAKKAVEAERQRLYDVLETLPVYAVLLTPDYHVAFANRFFRERFGEAHGRRCFEYLFGRTEPCEKCETYKILDTKAPLFWEWTGPDGRDYDIFDFPFTDSDGSPLILEVGIDITGRKQAEKALKEINETLEQRIAERTAELSAQKQLLEAVFESSHVQLVFLDRDFNFVRVNEAYARACARSKEEFAGRNHFELYPSDAQAIFERVRDTGRPYMAVARPFIFPDHPEWGETYWDWTLTPVKDPTGLVTGLVFSLVDVTGRIRQQRQLEEANRLKDEFLSMASHELKTPITSIKIFAEMAIRRPEMVKAEFLSRVLRQTDQLSTLINDLLEVSRLQLGRMPVDMRRLDLPALLREVCARPALEARLNFNPPPQASLVVTGDPVRLEQVFTNLVDNALKYSPEGSRIRLRVSRRGDKARVEVQDEGIGIAPEHLPHIFERFYKPGPQQAVYSGLGVGLYISKEIVGRHGGRIWAESEVGQGSTFFVELPLAENR